MKFRKYIFHFLLIGILFQTFHDYVFYKIDPCMKHIETAYQVNDGYCQIHENLHMPYIKPFVFIPKERISNEDLSDFYIKPVSKPAFQDIFKPPKLA